MKDTDQHQQEAALGELTSAAMFLKQAKARQINAEQQAIMLGCSELQIADAVRSGIDAR